MTSRRHVVLHTILIVTALLWLFPVVWTIMSGLKSDSTVYTQPWQLPSEPKFSNFGDAWQQGHLGRAFRNSIIVTTASVIFTLLVAVPAAYALARLRPRMRALVSLILLLPISLPPEVVIIPLFLMFRDAGLLNSFQGLVVINTGLNVSIATLLLTQFFSAIPVQIDEAASIDGAGRLRILLTMILPLSRAGLGSVALFVAVFSWNEYFNSLIIVQKPEFFTIQLAMNSYTTAFATEQGLLFAALGMSIIPPLVAFMLFQRKFATGLTQGALKG